MIASAGPTALWYLTRGTGAVALILLTVSLVLGIVDVRRWQRPTWPRFLVDGLHRNVSLLALALLVVHIVTSVIDGFAPIRITDAILPFISAYRPIWLGLGALAFDLMLALIITSVLRQRIGARAWRAIHWSAYACWPLAFVHGLGSGTDTKLSWMLVINFACLLAVLVAAAVRTRAGWPAQRTRRTSAAAALVAGPALLIAWLPGGPLGARWARRAGTPAALLAAARTAQIGSASASSTARSAVDAPFTAQVSGTITQGTDANSRLVVDLRLRLSGAGDRRLHIRLEGQRADGGGVAMTASQVTLASAGEPAIYNGAITSLDGTEIGAHLVRADGRALDLIASLTIDQSAGTVAGEVVARPA